MRSTPSNSRANHCAPPAYPSFPAASLGCPSCLSSLSRPGFPVFSLAPVPPLLPVPPSCPSEFHEDAGGRRAREELIVQVRRFKRPRVDARRTGADVMAIEDVQHFREDREPCVAFGERAIQPQIEARVGGNPWGG